MFGKCFGKYSDSSNENIRVPPSVVYTKTTPSQKKSQNETHSQNGSDYDVRRGRSPSESRRTSVTVKNYATPARMHEVSLPIVDVTVKERESTRATLTRKSIFRRPSISSLAGTPGPALNVIVPATPYIKDLEKQIFVRKSQVVTNSRTFGTQTERRDSTMSNLDKGQPRTSLREKDEMFSVSSSSTISFISDQKGNEMKNSGEGRGSREPANVTKENRQKDTDKPPPSRTLRRPTLVIEEDFPEVYDTVPIMALPKPIRDMIDTQNKEIGTILEDILYFRQRCLEVHNAFRELHNAGPLKLDMKICNYAQEWANYMAESDNLDQQNKSQYGSNLFKGFGTTYTAKMIVKHWYDEVARYNFSKPGLTGSTAHFTQVVWASSILLGVGMKKRDRNTFVVCIYEPAGNVAGMFQENVAPPATLKLEEALSKAETHLTSVEFATACLEMHNTYRAKHKSPALQLNNHMNNYAADWAQQLAKYGFLRHRPNNKYGENVFLATNYDPSAEEVVSKWYNECNNYNYDRPTFDENTGNFTQIVWKRTAELGVGIAKIGKSTYVVCNYAPRGNAVDHYISNVLRPTSSENTLQEEISGRTVWQKRDESIEATISHMSTFEEDCLNAHNSYRAAHDCPPLTLSRQLCNYAQEWANHLAAERILEHRHLNEYGENLYFTTAEVNGEDPVRAWYEEIKNYYFNNPGFHATTGHFTQVIWKSTRQLGVGKAVRDNLTFVVCNYEPPGNVIKRFENNVPPIAKQARDRSNYLKSDDDTDKPIDLGGAFEEQCLKAHNKYRTMHGCPPLQVNRVLNVYALDWAKQLCRQNILTRRSGGLYGENIYYAQGFKPNGSDVVNTWYNEIHEHNFQNPESSLKSGHFTQLIWKTSRELGVAAISVGDRSYVVCNYSPPGNVVGHFEHNVPPAFVMRPEIQMQEKKIRQSIGRTSLYTNQLDAFVFTEEILKKHNAYRGKHRVPPVELSEKLIDAATEWANYLANTDSLKNRLPNLYGECLFKATGWNVTPEEVMTHWYNEGNNYRSDDPKPSNFTQIVWKDSKYIGVGLAKRGDSMWIVVNYEPPGNYANQYKENVLPAPKKAVWM